MPLPPSLDRELLHVRNIDLRGFRRSDGAFEIEGRVTDIKNHSLQPPGRDAPLPVGVPIHDMSVRLVIDDNMRISEVIAVTDAGPYKDCPEATESLNALRGASIGPGWTARVKGLLGGQSCTHLVELLIPIATVAYQTLAPVRFTRADRVNAAGKPVKIDSCYAYAQDRTLVKKLWPEHYTGPGSSNQHRQSDK